MRPVGGEDWAPCLSADNLILSLPVSGSFLPICNPSAELEHQRLVRD